MTIRFSGHVEKQEVAIGDNIKITIHGETAICREPIVVYCPKADARMYPPGQHVQVQIHPLDESWKAKL